MNFEIQKRALSTVIRNDLDALVVLWPSQDEALISGQDPIAALVRAAVQHGDFERKPGDVLSLYAHPGIKARHLVIVCVAEAAPAHIRGAMLAAWGALKSAKIKRMGLHSAAELTPKMLSVAVSTLADATYSYTTTLSKPKARTLKQVVFSADVVTSELRGALAQAQALLVGVETAKEWANRPANHCTPVMLADAAKSIAKGAASSVKCSVPRRSPNWAWGRFWR